MAARTVVLVHGAWHGSWCWDLVVPQLHAAGVPTIAVDLPMSGFADDVECVRRGIADATTPVVLVGHSYGGVVITEAGRDPAVEHLVYLCAFAADEGRSAMNAVDDELPSTDLGAAVHIDGAWATLDREGARSSFYNGCAPGDAEAALDRLRPIAIDSLSGTVGVPAWRDRPSTYVVCTDDQAVHPALQRRLASVCSTVVEWPTGHSPFLTRPDDVAALLLELATR
jgi:pimeloyl-ACP methyl ester carboxylesterase